MSIFDRKRAVTEDDEEGGKAAEAKFAAIETEQKAIKEGIDKTQQTLSSLSETIKAINEREAEADAARKRATSEANKPQPKTQEEILSDFENDPVAFARNANAGTTQLALATSAKLLRNEILGEKEYYHGEVKKKTDEMLSREPLTAQNNANVIENCYLVQVGQHLDSIKKGEIKTRAAMSSGGDSSAKGGSKEGDGAKPSVDYRGAKSQALAAAFGVTDDDIVAAAKEGIHGLEVTY